MKVSFTVYGSAVPKQSFRFRQGGHHYQPARVKDWAENVAWSAKAAMIGKDPLEGELRAEMKFYRGDKRKVDLDNLHKNVSDALNGIVYNDDSQVIELHLYKLYDKLEPRVEITVENL